MPSSNVCATAMALDDILVFTAAAAAADGGVLRVLVSVLILIKMAISCFTKTEKVVLSAFG